MRIRSKFSLLMTVKNVREGLRATLASLGTMKPDELILVDGGSTDGTVEAAEDWCVGVDFKLVEVSPRTHPELHVRDVPESYPQLADEAPPGPFTGEQILTDWASARNLGLAQVSPKSDWVLSLDAEDVVVRPDDILGDMLTAKRERCQIIAGTYEVEGVPGTYARHHFARRGLLRRFRVHDVWSTADFDDPRLMRTERALRDRQHRRGRYVHKGSLHVCDTRASAIPIARSLRNLKVAHLAVAHHLSVRGDEFDARHDTRCWLTEMRTPGPGAIALFERLNPPPEELSFTLTEIGLGLDDEPERAREILERAWNVGRHPMAAVGLAKLAMRNGDDVSRNVFIDLALAADDEERYVVEMTHRQILDQLHLSRIGRAA